MPPYNEVFFLIPETLWFVFLFFKLLIYICLCIFWGWINAQESVALDVIVVKRSLCASVIQRMLKKYISV